MSTGPVAIAPFPTAAVGNVLFFGNIDVVFSQHAPAGKCCFFATFEAARHRCEKSNAVSVFGTHQGMYMARAPKRRKKSKTLSSSIKTVLKSAKFGTLFALPILTFCPSNPSGASAKAVLTLQKGQKGGAPF
jgi:hypothetical protein